MTERTSGKVGETKSRKRFPAVVVVLVAVVALVAFWLCTRADPRDTEIPEGSLVFSSSWVQPATSHNEELGTWDLTKVIEDAKDELYDKGYVPRLDSESYVSIEVTKIANVENGHYTVVGTWKERGVDGDLTRVFNCQVWPRYGSFNKKEVAIVDFSINDETVEAIRAREAKLAEEANRNTSGASSTGSSSSSSSSGSSSSTSSSSSHRSSSSSGSEPDWVEETLMDAFGTTDPDEVERRGQWYKEKGDEFYDKYGYYPED